MKRASSFLYPGKQLLLERERLAMRRAVTLGIYLSGVRNRSLWAGGKWEDHGRL